MIPPYRESNLVKTRDNHDCGERFDLSQPELSEWFGGFFDGEGYISTDVRAKDYALGYDISTSVSLNQVYMAGLMDAEGYVGIPIQDSDSTSTGYMIGQLAEISNEAGSGLLRRIQLYFESIGIEPSIYHGKQNNSLSEYWEVRVNKRDDVGHFLEKIRPYTVVKSLQIDLMLKEIIPKLDSGRHTNRRGFLEVIAWRDVLNSYKGGQRGKYNLDYFENEWSMRIEPTKIPPNHPRRKR